MLRLLLCCGGSEKASLPAASQESPQHFIWLSLQIACMTCRLRLQGTREARRCPARPAGTIAGSRRDAWSRSRGSTSGSHSAGRAGCCQSGCERRCEPVRLPDRLSASRRTPVAAAHGGHARCPSPPRTMSSSTTGSMSSSTSRRASALTAGRTVATVMPLRSAATSTGTCSDDRPRLLALPPRSRPARPTPASLRRALPRLLCALPC